MPTDDALIIEIHYRRMPWTEGDHGRVRRVVVPGLRREEVLTVIVREAEMVDDAD